MRHPRPATGRVRTWAATVAVVALLAGSVVLVSSTVHYDEPDVTRWAHGLLTRFALCWLLAAMAVAALWAVPRRRAMVLILAGGIALQVVAAAVPPTTSDDYYRYGWDGTVQSHGIDPFRYPPVAPQLAPLREPWLFPTDLEPDPKAAGNPDVTDACTSSGVPHVCTNINRPTVRTIYPPVAQAWFLLLHVVSPKQHRGVGLQVGSAALAVLLSLALLILLSRTGRNPRWAALWAWCPLVWSECGNNAHVEVLGVLLLVLAVGVLDAASSTVSVRRAVLCGGLFGAAIGAKLLPALAGPALLRRGRSWVITAAAVAVFLGGYVPHVAAVGTAVLGYLPGYFREEGYNGAIRFGALHVLVPTAAAPLVGFGIVMALALVVVVAAGRMTSATGAVVLLGATLAIVGPSQPWYGLLPVGLAALSGRWEWLPVAACGYFVYLAGDLGIDSTTMQERTYLPALLFAATVTAARRALPHVSTRRRAA